MGKGKEVLVVLCTTPPDAAEGIAKTLVEERLAACVNVVPAITSFYWWEGKLQRDGESLLVIKTTPEAYGKLESRLKELHPYTVPEILALPVHDGNTDYINWVLGEVSGHGEA